MRSQDWSPRCTLSSLVAYPQTSYYDWVWEYIQDVHLISQHFRCYVVQDRSKYLIWDQWFSAAGQLRRLSPSVSSSTLWAGTVRCHRSEFTVVVLLFGPWPKSKEGVRKCKMRGWIGEEECWTEGWWETRIGRRYCTASTDQSSRCTMAKHFDLVDRAGYLLYMYCMYMCYMQVIYIVNTRYRIRPYGLHWYICF